MAHIIPTLSPVGPKTLHLHLEHLGCIVYRGLFGHQKLGTLNPKP